MTSRQRTRGVEIWQMAYIPTRIRGLRMSGDLTSEDKGRVRMSGDLTSKDKGGRLEICGWPKAR